MLLDCFTITLMSALLIWEMNEVDIGQDIVTILRMVVILICLLLMDQVLKK